MVMESHGKVMESVKVVMEFHFILNWVHHSADFRCQKCTKTHLRAIVVLKIFPGGDIPGPPLKDRIECQGQDGGLKSSGSAAR